MNEFNPYASPVADAEVITNPFSTSNEPGGGVWRRGKILIMHKNARLPDFCVKTNAPADQRVKRNLTWLHPAWALLILIALLVYLIVALILTKKAKVEFPVSNDWMKKRNFRLMISIITFLVGGLIFVGAIFTTVNEGYAEGLIAILYLTGTVIGLGGVIAAASFSAILRPTKITETHVYLKGSHPDYLDRFPVWAYD